MIQALHTIYGRKYAVQNTFIGGVGATINTPALLATKLGISASRITLFEVVGSEVRCNISGSYTMRQDAFIASTELTYFDDKEGMVTGMLRHPFRQSTEVESLFFKGLLSCEEFAFADIFGGKLKTIYIPNCTLLGSSVLYNGVFRNINSGAKLYVHPSLATNNAGAPDVDLTYAIGSGAIVSYVSNFSAPNQITTLTSGIIYNTSIQLNFTPPSSTNAIDYYEVYVNGVYFKDVKNSGDYLFGLTPSTAYTYEIIAVDIFYNKSVKSNVLSVSTNTTEIPYLLFASYRFENNANDYLGVHNATPTALTYASGKVGQGAVFNGSSSFAIIPNNNVFSFTDGTNDKPFSIGVHVKFNSTGNQWIVNKRDSITLPNEEWQLIYVSGKLSFTRFSQGASSSYIDLQKTFTPTIGTWYRVTYTFDGVNGKLFIDKVDSLATKTTVGTYVKMNNTPSVVTIGKYGWAGSGYLKGSLDNLDFFNKELSASEISDIIDIYNSGNNLM